MRYGMSAEFPLKSSTGIVHPSTNNKAIDSERSNNFKTLKLSECFSDNRDFASINLKENHTISRNLNRRYNTESAGKRTTSRNKTLDSKFHKMLKKKYAANRLNKVQSVDRNNKTLVDNRDKSNTDGTQRRKILKQTIFSPINRNMNTVPKINIENQAKKSVNFKNESRFAQTMRSLENDMISTQCNTQIFKLGFQTSSNIITKDVKSKISQFSRFF